MVRLAKDTELAAAKTKATETGRLEEALVSFEPDVFAVPETIEREAISLGDVKKLSFLTGKI